MVQVTHTYSPSAFFITLASSFLSDRMKQRGYFNVFWMTIVCIGYAILLGIDVVEKPGVAYFAVRPEVFFSDPAPGPG